MSSQSKIISRRGLIVGAATLPVVSSCGYLSNTDKVDSHAYVVKQQIFTQNPEAAQASQQASATLLFPEIIKAGFGLGGAHGDGVMYVNNNITGRYNLSAATVGFQAGIESFSMMLLLMTPDAVAKFNKYLGVDFGADIEFALPTKGLNYGTTASSFITDTYAMIFNQAGVMAGASIQGAKYTKI